MDKFINPLYMTKTDLIYRAETNENPEEIWNKLQRWRRENGVNILLKDQKKNNFFFVITNELKKKVVEIDDLARSNIFEQLDEKSKIEMIRNAQEDEAFYSSIIEGAHTTKQRTKEMVENKVMPKTKDEKMVLNNYHALMYILENLHKEIDEKTILDIYEIVTKDTLEEENISKGYRDGQNYVSSMEQIIYTPPEAEEVKWMMSDLIQFINNDDDERIHIIIKALVIHFYFVYIHPFYDGNGRTARALTYMYLLKNGYQFFKFFSISSILKEYRTKYYKSIKNVEDYDSDVTYFILFNLEILEKSIRKVSNDFKNQYLLKIISERIEKKGLELNERQKKIIEKVIKYDKKQIDIEYYKRINKVVQETARKDLDDLVEMDIFTKEKLGKKNIYTLGM